MTRELDCMAANFDLILERLQKRYSTAPVAKPQTPAPYPAPYQGEPGLEAHEAAHENFLMDMSGCNEPGDGAE